MLLATCQACLWMLAGAVDRDAVEHCQPIGGLLRMLARGRSAVSDYKLVQAVFTSNWCL